MSTQNPQLVFEKAQKLVDAGGVQVSRKYRHVELNGTVLTLDHMSFAAFRECTEAKRVGREPDFGVLAKLEQVFVEVAERRGQTQLQFWSVVHDISDPFLPPEMRKSMLKGEVYNHPRQPDGKVITTSRIVSSEGRYVTTSSGTIYLLGRVDGGYRKFLRDNGLSYDWRNPIKVREI